MKPDKFFNGRGVDFLDSQIATCLQEAKSKIDSKDVKDTKTMVEEFLKAHRFIDLLPGHFAFGLIRRFIIHKLRQGGITHNTADNHIRSPLSRSVWDLVNSNDHESLKERLRKAVQEVAQMRRFRGHPSVSDGLSS